MLQRYKEMLKRESREIEYYNQFHILNPCNLPDMSQYPMLGSGEVTDIVEQWSMCTHCNAIGINTTHALHQWWQSGAPSPL